MAGRKPLTERDKAINMMVGRNIRRRRLDMDLSSAEAGRLIDVTRQMWRQWEIGHRGMTIRTLYQIADALQVDARDFLTEATPDLPIPKLYGQPAAINVLTGRV